MHFLLALIRNGAFFLLGYFVYHFFIHFSSICLLYCLRKTHKSNIATFNSFLLNYICSPWSYISVCSPYLCKYNRERQVFFIFLNRIFYCLFSHTRRICACNTRRGSFLFLSFTCRIFFFHFFSCAFVTYVSRLWWALVVTGNYFNAFFFFFFIVTCRKEHISCLSCNLLFCSVKWWIMHVVHTSPGLTHVLGIVMRLW